MIAQGRGGRIIGACSGLGKQGYASLSAYSSSKFGIRALTQCAGASHLTHPSYTLPLRLRCCSPAEAFRVKNPALEFGAHGITVNAYAPGPVKTPLCTLSTHPLSRHSSNAYQGMALWPWLVLESRIRYTHDPIPLPRHVCSTTMFWTVYKGYCTWSYRVAHRRCSASLLPLF